MYTLRLSATLIHLKHMVTIKAFSTGDPFLSLFNVQYVNPLFSVCTTFNLLVIVTYMYIQQFWVIIFSNYDKFSLNGIRYFYCTTYAFVV